MTNKLNNKGFTLLELIVSIAVGSIVLSMLIQMLVMSVQARNEMQVNSRLQDEAYLLAEQLKWNIFEHETQSASINVTGSVTTVTFNHDHDITIDPLSHAISFEPSTKPPHTLVFDTGGTEILYNGVRLHSSTTHFGPNTSFNLTAVDDTCVPTTTSCSYILTLTLEISVELDNGSLIDYQYFETTIII